MKPDYQPSPYTVKRPRRGFLVVIGGVAVLVLAAVMLRSFDAGEGERVGRAPASEMVRGSTDVVGTTGEARPAGTENNSGPAAVVPPAIIQELGTITGSVDGHELIGRRVDLHVTVQDVANDVAFWAGEGDNRVLVVMGRDDRTGAERQRGLPSSSGVARLAAGEQAAVSGTVQRLPRAEEMHSWQLSRADAQELLDRRIYVRADSVTTNGHSATR
jgi:hypothetical protein